MAGKGSKSRVTQKTIADAAGLAITTVSKALAGDPKIARATREKVERIAAEIGYIPDRAAQRLRTGKTRVFNLVLNPHTELLDFANAMIIGITQALENSDYHLVVSPHFGEGDIREPIEHIVDNNLADGVFFSRVQPFDPRVKYLQEKDVPFVCHGRTNFSTPHSFVDFDNEALIELAVGKLAADGARKICVILPPESLTFHQHVKRGAIKSAADLGVECIFADQVTLDSSLAEISAWAAKMATTSDPSDRPDGFVFLGEASYFAAISAFRANGFERGRDFNVVVKRHSELLTHIDPGVSVVFEDIVKAGREMGQMLLQQVAGTPAPPVQYIDRPTTVDES